MKNIPLLLAALSLCAPVLGAEESKEGERKEKVGELINELFVGEKIYLQDKGEINLVFTPSYASNGDEKEFEFSTELQYGLTNQIQLSAEVPLVNIDAEGEDPHLGIGDISAAININFIQTDNFAMGVRNEFVIPTGDDHRDLGGGEFVWEPQLLAGLRIGQLELYAAAGAEFGDDHDAFTYTVAGAYPWQKFAGVLEFTGVSGGGEDILYVAPGIDFKPAHNVELEFGVPIGLTEDSDDFQVVARLVVEL